MSSIPTLISQHTKDDDWLWNEDYADIAKEKFDAMLAKPDPIFFRAACESFTAEDAPAALAQLFADPQGFRDMLVGRMIREMKDQAECEAIEAVERIERQDWIRQEVEYFYNHA